ncbi:hypothetical protein MHYP_G00172570 [Metynnis hypsauchen]
MSAEDQQHTSSEMTTLRPRLEDEDGWMNVKWDKGRKREDGPAFFPAKVLMISDNYTDLCQKREEFIKGVNIWNQTLKRKTKPNSRWMKDREDKDERPTKQSNTEKEESSDEDLLPRNWSKAQQKIKELKRENKRLKEGNV